MKLAPSALCKSQYCRNVPTISQFNKAILGRERHTTFTNMHTHKQNSINTYVETFPHTIKRSGGENLRVNIFLEHFSDKPARRESDDVFRKSGENCRATSLQPEENHRRTCFHCGISPSRTSTGFYISFVREVDGIRREYGFFLFLRVVAFATSAWQICQTRFNSIFSWRKDTKWESKQRWSLGWGIRPHLSKVEWIILWWKKFRVYARKSAGIYFLTFRTNLG